MSERGDMGKLESQLNNLKSQYEMKKLKIYELNTKLEDKNKLLNEAEKAFSKVIHLIRYKLSPRIIIKG